MVIKEYILNSSIHGIHFIADKRFHGTERFFWILCVIGSWVGSYILISSVMNQYNSQTVTFTADTLYLDWETKFPAVFFCENRNEERLAQLRKIWFPIPFKNHDEDPFNALSEMIFFSGILSNDKVCHSGTSTNPSCSFTNISAYTEAVNSSFTKSQIVLPPNLSGNTKSKCHDIFSSCFYDNKEFSCCDKFKAVESSFGICYAVNSLAAKDGADNAPFIISRASNNGYGNLSVETTNNNYYIIALGQESVPSVKNMDLQLLDSSALSQIPIRKNFSYNIFLSIKDIISEESVRSIDIEERGCRFFDENNLNYSDLYSLSSCQNECYISAHKHVCDCRLHIYPKLDPREECNSTGIICIANRLNEIDEYYNQHCNCLNSCFNTEVKLLGEVRYNMTALNKKMRDKHSAVQFNFITLSPTIRYNRAMVKAPLDMIVSVGGTLGLFVGASLLTFFEIFYYFLIRPLGDRAIKIRQRKEVEEAKLKEDHHQQMKKIDSIPFTQ